MRFFTLYITLDVLEYLEVLELLSIFNYFKVKVLKFGGTSVGSVESLLNVKQIVTSQSQPVIVVVSALGGVTNQLIEMTRLAQSGSNDYESILEQVAQRHRDVIAGVVPQPMQGQCNAIVEQFIANLRSFYGTLALNRELPAVEQQRLADAIVCHGEVMSSAIVSCMIEGAVPHFAPNFIKTRECDGSHALEAELTRQLIANEWPTVEGIHVVQGFIADDADEHFKTNLGRGGSDYTAALIAAALHAECLEIWTDVDGFYDKDPRKHTDAQLLPSMTYAQAQELCDAGAKVIYPPTLRPVAELSIPVWVKNTFNLTAPGTCIH